MEKLRIFSKINLFEAAASRAATDLLAALMYTTLAFVIFWATGLGNKSSIGRLHQSWRINAYQLWRPIFD